MKQTLLLSTLVCSILGTVRYAVEAAPADASPEAAASTGERYLLRYKFKMGEVIRYGVKHSADVRSTIESTSQQARSTSESIKVWKVTDVLPDGQMEFVNLVESVRMSNRVPNRAVVKYDSQTDKTPPPSFQQAAQAVGVPLSVIRLAPDGLVIQREEKHPQPAPSDDMPITLQLPPEPLAVGEQWAETYEVPVERKSGAILQVRTRRVCNLKHVKSGVATITVEYQILTPVDAFVESQLVERLSKGTVRFDVEQGRVLSKQMVVDRRILGFAGEVSSMHYVSRLEERLLKPDEQLARKPAKPSTVEKQK